MSERADARADRLKAALRENLRRRKVQVRGRGEAAEGGTPTKDAAAQPDEQNVSVTDEATS